MVRTNIIIIIMTNFTGDRTRILLQAFIKQKLNYFKSFPISHPDLQ